MNLQSKLNALVQAQDVLLKSAALPESVRHNMYELPTQISAGNKLISEIMKEIREVSNPKSDDDIPF